MSYRDSSQWFGQAVGLFEILIRSCLWKNGAKGSGTLFGLCESYGFRPYDGFVHLYNRAVDNNTPATVPTAYALSTFDGPNLPEEQFGLHRNINLISITTGSQINLDTWNGREGGWI
jgi:hypothetical protein